MLDSEEVTAKVHKDHSDFFLNDFRTETNWKGVRVQDNSHIVYEIDFEMAQRAASWTSSGTPVLFV